eukprot:jgi/Botrbrau1/21112/Bobra.0061s0007.1
METPRTKASSRHGIWAQATHAVHAALVLALTCLALSPTGAQGVLREFAAAPDEGSGGPGTEAGFGGADPRGPTVQHSQGSPVGPYAIVNFQEAALRQRASRVPKDPSLLEMPDDAQEGPPPLEWLPDQDVGSDRGPEPIITILSEGLFTVSNGSLPTRNSSATRQASVGGGWVKTGIINEENAKIYGYPGIGVSDMALCAGSGYVLQGVNAVFSVYSAATGNRLSGPVSILDLFKTPVNYKTKLMFDPRCIYDGYNKRFFVAALRSTPVTAPRTSPYFSDVLLGVSATSDPRGNWFMYTVDAAYGNPPCTQSAPCMCDYTTLGQDRYGIWVGCNLVKPNDITVTGYIGQKVFAFGKRILLNGGTVVPQQYFYLGPANLGGNLTLFLMPAITQGAGQDNTNNGGTMYFVGTYGCCTIELFTITNTQLLSSNGRPTIPPGRFIYTQNVADGPTTVAIRNGLSATIFGTYIQMVAYINGKLYMMRSGGKTINGRNWSGLAWFVINPNQLTVEKQGFISVLGWDFYNPALTADEQGNMAFVCQASGPADSGITSARGSIDGTTGKISNLMFFTGNPGTFPIDPGTTISWRAGDYSSIIYSDDGFFYGSTETSFANPSNSRFPGSWKWGTTIWGRMRATP